LVSAYTVEVTDNSQQNPSPLSSVLYFAVTAVVMLACLGASWRLNKKAQMEVRTELESSVFDPIPSNNISANGYIQIQTTSDQEGNLDISRNSTNDVISNPAFMEECYEYNAEGVLTDTILPLLAIFMQTLSIFPAITATIEPISPGINVAIFTSLSFLIFNFALFVGTMCSGKWIFSTLPVPNYQIILRTVCPILVLTANTVLRNKNLEQLPRYLPLLIRSDFLYLCLLALLGFTHGYFVSRVVSNASSNLTPSMKRKIGAVIAVCCSVGSFCGGLFSFPIRSIICGGCNPFSSN